MSAEYLYCFENTILARQCKLFLDYVFIPKDKGSYTEKLYHVVNVQTNSRSYETCSPYNDSMDEMKATNTDHCNMKRSQGQVTPVKQILHHTNIP